MRESTSGMGAASKRRSLRITCVISSLGPGGGERVLTNLASWFTDRGDQVTVVTLRNDVPDFHDLPQAVSRVVAASAVGTDRRWFDLRGQLRKRRALRATVLATAPQVVISFLDITNIEVLWALQGTKIPIVISEQVDPRSHPIGWRWQLLRRLWYPTAACVTMLTPDLASWGQRRWPRWRVATIPNPVSTPRFSDGPAAPLPGDRNALAMGRLVPQKGFDYLLSAFSRVAQSHPAWHLTILGEGPLRRELEELRDSLHLEDRVHLPGLVTNPWDVLRAADLFVLSSRYEGFPNALMEAMACGVAPVSFDCPTGPREIIREGVDGLLVPPGDASALAAAMDRLIGDEQLLALMSRRAQEVLRRFGIPVIMTDWGLIIDRIANRLDPDSLPRA